VLLEKKKTTFYNNH